MIILIEYNRNLELVKSFNIYLNFFWIIFSFFESNIMFFFEKILVRIYCFLCLCLENKFVFFFSCCLEDSLNGFCFYYKIINFWRVLVYI